MRIAAPWYEWAIRAVAVYTRRLPEAVMPRYCFVRPENAGWTFLSDIAVMGKNAHPTLKSILDRALAGQSLRSVCLSGLSCIFGKMLSQGGLGRRCFSSATLMKTFGPGYLAPTGRFSVAAVRNGVSGQTSVRISRTTWRSSADKWANLSDVSLPDRISSILCQTRVFTPTGSC